ncbi:MAG: SDR family oxidoreductase [Geobacteraceae bacterium]|nr:SDR family oxidoreductase [Geobacteraceae bacterium]
MSLKEKKVVIIGGSSGMGLASARAAAAEGAYVLIAGRSRERLKKALDEIEGEADAHSLDVTREDEVRDFFADLGTFDHLVTTAASGASGPFLEIDSAAVREVFESKFWGQYYAARYGAAGIQPGGSITMFAGVASHKPLPGLVAYAAVNGAVEGLCRTLAVELAPLRVNVISPGLVMTPVYAAMPEPEREAMFETVAAKLPVGRVGRPEDVAGTVLYLMKNGYTTGTVIHVDGGHRLV